METDGAEWASIIKEEKALRAKQEISKKISNYSVLTSQKTQCAFITKINQLMPYRETEALYWKCRAECINVCQMQTFTTTAGVQVLG